MFRRSILFTAGVLLLSGLVIAGGWSPRVVAKIQDHAVAIAVYYVMSAEQIEKRVAEIRAGKVEGGAAVFIAKVGEEQALCRLGSGTMLPDDYILTARHLFAEEKGATRRVVWVIHPRMDKPLEADVFYISDLEGVDKEYYDYAVLRLRLRMGLPGLKVATASPAMGEEVAYGGSLRGTAFFLRFGVATRLQRVFRKDDKGTLHLSLLQDFQYVVVYPGGPGDSGSGIFTVTGEICGMGYCYIDLNGTGFLMSNPVETLHRFLREAQLSQFVPR